MKSPKQLRKPENWQDFETLCKKLWGEIWICPEIKKNGRLGQKQNGVDVYGIPHYDSEYYGIQCKGKNEYNHSQLSEKEIENEIKKAKEFRPKIKKFYFVTTANKDSSIEEYVREINVKNKKNGEFEVHLFSWEDVVDLIDENKQTHDWYIKSNNYKSNQSVLFTFNDDSVVRNGEVTFLKNIVHYIDETKMNNFEASFSKVLKPLQLMLQPNSMLGNNINHSYYNFSFKIKNTGNVPINEYAVFLKFEGDFSENDTCRKGNILTSGIHFKYDTFISDDCKSGKIKPNNKILVPNDEVIFDEIAIKPATKKSTIHIHWELVSVDFQDNGTLTLIINPKFKTTTENKIIYDENFVRTEEKIKDYITETKL